MISGHSEGETPGLIPNPEVKPFSDWFGSEFSLAAYQTLLIIYCF